MEAELTPPVSVVGAENAFFSRISHILLLSSAIPDSTSTDNATPSPRGLAAIPTSPQPAPPVTFPHLPSEGQPGLLCAPFCVSFPTTASRLSAHPENQVTNHFSHHPVPILQISFTLLFFPSFSKAVLLNLTSQMPIFFLLLHISFFLTVSQFLFRQ